MARLHVTYRTNPAYENSPDRTPRLFATIDLQRYGAAEIVTALPIYFRRLERPIGPVREVYSTVVAGLPVEKGNLNSLENTLDLYLRALVHFGRLPEYVFCLQQRAWPIYRLPDQLVSRYPGSPVFSAPSIGRLRVALADYFKLAGHITNRKELGLLSLAKADLQLHPPICVFRAPQTADTPAFPITTRSGSSVVAPVNAKSLVVPLLQHTDLLVLHSAVADYLREKGRITDASEVTLRKLAPDTWAALRSTLTPEPRVLAYHDDEDGRMARRDVPVFAHGPLLVAARTNRLGRTALFVAPTMDELKHRLGEELHEENKLSSPHYVTVRETKTARANPFSTGAFGSVLGLAQTTVA